MTRRPSIWCSTHVPGHSKLFVFIFVKLQKKKKIETIFARILQEIMKKNNTWNIRRLVAESFVPSTHGPSVLYWRSSDFYMTLGSLRSCVLPFIYVKNPAANPFLCWCACLVCYWRCTKSLVETVNPGCNSDENQEASFRRKWPNLWSF